MFLRNVHINVNQNNFITQKTNLNLCGLVNTRMYRKTYCTRAEAMPNATVCALSLYSIVRKNIALH
jgi:hypothetical protein